MNKSLLKSFATAARVRLMQDVRYRLGLMGITDKGIARPLHSTPDMEEYEYARGQSFRLFGADVAARGQLADMAQAKGYEQLVEEVAYTWFNRLIAIRFMEVNDYLPGHTRVLSSAAPGQNTPDIVTRALDIDLGLSEAEKQQVLEWKLANQADEVFRFMFLKQCQQLAGLLPGMFSGQVSGSVPSAHYSLTTKDPYALLLTISCISPDGIVAELLKIPEAYFNVSPQSTDEDGEQTGQVEIIGWLYQYYIDDKRDQVINIYKGTVKKDDIPAATQLFTTDWVVKYMVENSLGRVWLESHPNHSLQAKWKYFMKTDTVSKDSVLSVRTPEELKVFDPCVGSGHILVYAFDVLMDIYRSVGYLAKDAARLIVQKNLYGLDIDKRAAQLAYFAVMMKSMEHDRDFLHKAIKPNVLEIHESNGLDILGGLPGQLRLTARSVELANELIDCYRDAKVYGSLIQADHLDLSNVASLQEGLIEESIRDITMSGWLEKAKWLLPHLVAQTHLLNQRYHAVITNPPYLNKYNDALKNFVKAVYKDYSADLFSCFMVRNFQLCMARGYTAFMTPFVWMFIKSYEKLRHYIIEEKAIASLIQMEYSAFEEATVPICTFILRNGPSIYPGNYLRLSEFRGGMAVQNRKVLEAQNNYRSSYRFYTRQKNFSKIPGSPVAYWVSEAVLLVYDKAQTLGEIASPKTGMTTGDNERFLRLWQEIDIDKSCFHALNAEDAESSGKKWFTYNKGGGFRRWYGYYEYLVNWENNGYEIKNNIKSNGLKAASVRSESLYFKPLISWSAVSSAQFSCRYVNGGSLFDSGGSSIYVNENTYYLLAVLNSKIGQFYLNINNATINYQPGDIGSIPIFLLKDNAASIDGISKQNIVLSQSDWNSFETSWDFRRHSLV